MVVNTLESSSTVYGLTVTLDKPSSSDTIVWLTVLESTVLLSKTYGLTVTLDKPSSSEVITCCEVEEFTVFESNTYGLTVTLERPVYPLSGVIFWLTVEESVVLA